MPWWGHPLKSLAKRLGLGKKEERKEVEDKEGLLATLRLRSHARARLRAPLQVVAVLRRSQPGS